MNQHVNPSLSLSPSISLPTTPSIIGHTEEKNPAKHHHHVLGFKYVFLNYEKQNTTYEETHKRILWE